MVSFGSGSGYTPVGVNITSDATGTTSLNSNWVNAFNSIYRVETNWASATGGTASNIVANHFWGASDQDAGNALSYQAPIQYINPRITLTTNRSAATDTTSFHVRRIDPWQTNPYWAADVETETTATLITINNSDLYATNYDAINQAYHYILRFVQGQGWKWEDGSKEQRKATYRSRLRGQMYPSERHRNDGPGNFGDVRENEIVALQLLKSMLPSERWRKYLKYGFVDVQAKSGLVYQVIRGSTHVKVFRQGEKIAELCVSLKNRYEIPPTDEVITRMILAECDEPDLWKRANAHGFRGKKPQNEEDLARIVIEKAA